MNSKTIAILLILTSPVLAETKDIGFVNPTKTEIPAPTAFSEEGIATIKKNHQEILALFNEIKDKLIAIEKENAEIRNMIDNKEAFVKCSSIDSIESDIGKVEEKLNEAHNVKLSSEEKKKLISLKNVYEKSRGEFKEKLSPKVTCPK